MYVLDADLQTVGCIHNKWKERSKIGIYLGRSPQHAQSVALVLNMTTGLVSPQFHVVFDSSFQMVKASCGGTSPKSLWQYKTGFVDVDGNTIEPSKPTTALKGAALRTPSSGELINQVPEALTIVEAPNIPNDMDLGTDADTYDDTVPLGSDADAHDDTVPDGDPVHTPPATAADATM